MEKSALLRRLIWETNGRKVDWSGESLEAGRSTSRLFQ